MKPLPLLREHHLPHFPDDAEVRRTRVDLSPAGDTPVSRFPEMESTRYLAGVESSSSSRVATSLVGLGR